MDRIRTTGILRAVFRLGVIEVGPGFMRYYNRTATGEVSLDAEQEARWRKWMLTQPYTKVFHD